MSIEVQFASLVTFVLALFVLYRLLVKSKEGEIGALNAQIALLKEKLADAKEQSAESLLLRHKEVLAASDDLVARSALDKKTSDAKLDAMRAEVNSFRQKVANLEDLLRRPTLGIVNSGLADFHSQTRLIGGGS